MPVTIYPTTLKYKNSNGQFQSATAIKGDSGAAVVVQVEGTSPTIVCEDNHRYICGEVLSLNITPPTNGVCEIIFESGSTATLLTIPNTIKWPEWFNPNSLETSATYQFKISNGLANVAIWPDEGLTGDTRVRIQKMLGVYQRGELIADVTVAEDATEIIVNTDLNGQSFQLQKLVAIFTAGPSTTGTRDSFYGQFSFIRDDGTTGKSASPSTTYPTATSNIATKIEIEVGNGLPIAMQAISAVGSGNTQPMQSMINPGVVKAITAFRIYQSDSTKSLIPAGANLKVYGIRA